MNGASNIMSNENNDAGIVISLANDSPTRSRRVLQENMKNTAQTTSHKYKTTASSPKLSRSIEVPDNREQQSIKPFDAMTPAATDDAIISPDENKICSTDAENPFSIIESAMSNNSLSKESKLAKVWTSWEENKSISIEEVLDAAIADLLNHQASLTKSEHNERNVLDMKVSSDQMDSDMRLQKRIGELETEIAALQNDAGAYHAKKEKMIANLKKRKTVIADLETKMEVAEKDLLNLTSENDSLRRGIEAVSEARDSLKNKLRCQQENTKEIKKSLQSAESAMHFFRDKCILQGEVSNVSDR
jgi:spore coat protein CotF